MKNLPTYDQWLNESESWESKLSKNEVDMVNGIVEILLQIKDKVNRLEVANTRIEDFKESGINMDTEIFLKMCGLKPENLKENISESTVAWSKIMRSIKLAKFPLTLVVVDKRNKVVKQEIVSIPDAIPAHFETLRKDFPKTSIHIEDSEGKRLWSHVDEYEGDSTQLASDLFLATQTAGATIAF
jgi:hypothetical protein